MSITNTRIQTIPTQIFLADGQQAITTIIFCNVTTATATTLSFFAVPDGSNAGVTTQVFNEILLPPGETFALDKERFVLDDNDAFYAQASSNDTITATISAVSTA